MKFSAIPITSFPDRVSLRGLLFDGAALEQRQLFFGYEPKLGTAMRDGNCKMIVKSSDVKLDDLSNEIGEQTDLSDDYPQQAREMKLAIDVFKKTIRKNG